MTAEQFTRQIKRVRYKETNIWIIGTVRYLYRSALIKNVVQELYKKTSLEVDTNGSYKDILSQLTDQNEHHPRCRCSCRLFLGGAGILLPCAAAAVLSASTGSRGYRSSELNQEGCIYLLLGTGTYEYHRKSYNCFITVLFSCYSLT